MLCALVLTLAELQCRTKRRVTITIINIR